jgi:uncharacterized protein YutE (UPF0331/DUF86 family)
MTLSPDEIVLQKTASIRRCVVRAREERIAAGSGFRSDFTHQDAALLNVFRACESAIDLANHLVRLHRLGTPAWSAQAFELLGKASLIPSDLATSMTRMVGFRNLAIHEYDRIDMDLVESLFEAPLEDLLRFADEASKPRS